MTFQVLSSTSSTPEREEAILPKMQEFKTLFAEYEAAMLAKSPNLPAYLDKVRSDLNSTPEILWRLSDSEIGIIVSGMMIHSGIQIASESAAKRSAKAGTAKVSLADLLGADED